VALGFIHIYFGTLSFLPFFPWLFRGFYCLSRADQAADFTSDTQLPIKSQVVVLCVMNPFNHKFLVVLGFLDFHGHF